MLKECYSVFVVDDDPDIQEWVGYGLREKGIQCTTFSDGFECLNFLRERKDATPDLILLDIMMPRMGGLETCENIRKLKLPHKPLIAFLTAKVEADSQLVGFEVGADDYIIKPIRPKVLMRRVDALLKHSKSSVNPSKTWFHKDLEVRFEYRLATQNGVELGFSQKEFQLMVLFLSQPKKVYDRQEIMKEIWPDQNVVETRTLDVHILNLRKKLGVGYIKTIKGVGYGLDS
jgi:two-component system alkaline phosphatase synthesis response regulator PhoP